MSNWFVEKYSLSPPPLSDLVPLLQSGLSTNFKDVTVEVATCPNLRQPPFHLAASGLSGNERIADIGGPPNLSPEIKWDRKYSLLEMTKLMEMSPEKGFILGAGAGPYHFIGQNSELAPNLAYSDGGKEVANLTHYAKIDAEGKVQCEKIADEARDCAFMANLFGSDGSPGDVLKVVAKTRTGKLNFTEAIQTALKEKYGKRTISIGGVFLIRKGKANLHVMPDFSKEPLKSREEVGKWLRYFDMSAPIVCLSVFHSHDPGLDLRIEHTHCFSDHNEGGHYHDDVTPDEVEYEAYLNLAREIYRIDRPHS